MTVVHVEDVSVAFGDAKILSAVSCAIEHGEFVGLVGPNGAGKTTLLRTISGAITPSAGQVVVDGIDVHDVRSKVASQRIATVPQTTSLSFSFPVRDVVAMGRYPHRTRFRPPEPEDRALVDSALERTATAHLADRHVDEVSGGERQRVLLARAIAQDTPVLLLDEPTASLDVNHQIETLELVAGCARDGKAVVAAIHDLELAARYCDRLLLLADGDIAKRGPPSQVLTHETIGESFDTTAIVSSNPITGTESVTALPAPTSGTVPGPVHVLGTGPDAARAMASLHVAGVELTAGPLVGTSVAAETARRLGVETTTVAPFSPLEAATIDAVASAIDRAAVTVDAGLEVDDRRLEEALSGADPLVTLEGAKRSGATECRPAELADAVHAVASPDPQVPADDD